MLSVAWHETQKAILKKSVGWRGGIPPLDPPSAAQMGGEPSARRLRRRESEFAVRIFFEKSSNFVEGSGAKKDEHQRKLVFFL